MKKELCWALIFTLALPALASAKRKYGMGSSFDDVMPGENINQSLAPAAPAGRSRPAEDAAPQPKARPASVKAPAPTQNKKKSSSDKDEVCPVDRGQLPDYFEISDNRPFWVDSYNAIVRKGGKYYALGVASLKSCGLSDSQIQAAEMSATAAAGEARNGFKITVTRGFNSEGGVTEEQKMFSQVIAFGAVRKGWVDTESGQIYVGSLLPIGDDQVPASYLELKRRQTAVDNPETAEQLDDSMPKIKVPRRAPEWLTENSYGHTKIGSEEVIFAIGTSANIKNSTLATAAALSNAAATMCKGYAKEQYIEDNALLKKNSLTYECTFHGLQVYDSWKDKDGNTYFYIVQRLYTAVAVQ